MRTTERDEPQSVLDRVVAILGAFESNDLSLSVAEIVRRTGIAKATAHRLIVNMEKHALVQRIDGSRVTLGTRLYELGHLASRERVLRDLALPVLGDLFETTKLTVNLAILEQTSVLYLVKLTSRSNIQLGSRIGGRLPAYCTGVGKAMLAFLPESYTQAVIAAPMPRLTPNTITEGARLIRELASVRESGLAFDRQEFSRGGVCVAAPILDKNGQAIAAISVSGRGEAKAEQRTAGAVKLSAQMISRQLTEYGMVFERVEAR